jgi:hypothetical protein
MINDNEFFLPSGYQHRDKTERCNQNDYENSGKIICPEIYEIVQVLIAGTHRSRIIDIGCGDGEKLVKANANRKIGLDFGENILRCKRTYPNDADWRELEGSQTIPVDLIDDIGPRDIVVCSRIIERLPDPTNLIFFLSQCFARGAAVITSTPDRDLVHGPNHMGPPASTAHVREWTTAEYGALLTSNGLKPLYLGLTFDNDRDRLMRTIVTVHEPRIQRQFRSSLQRPLAIMSVYNEEDVLSDVIDHWIAQGCDLHVLDNWSKDRSWDILIEAERRYGPHLNIERFPMQEPDSGCWTDILARKEEIAFCHKGRWIIHTDADELRVSPFDGYNLADSMAMVEAGGWNRITFTVLNHCVVDDRPFYTGMLKTQMPFFEFASEPGHLVQAKAWLQGNERVDLTDSGGHIVKFSNAMTCPYRFTLHHYPLRSVEQAFRKINTERNGRWSEIDLKKGWHTHYGEYQCNRKFVKDSNLLHDSRDNVWAKHGLQILFLLRCNLR